MSLVTRNSPHHLISEVLTLVDKVIRWRGRTGAKRAVHLALLLLLPEDPIGSDRVATDSIRVVHELDSIGLDRINI